MTPTRTARRISQADARRYKEHLEAIEELLSAEIRKRFGSDALTEEQAGRNSRIYALLSLPRDMARGALRDCHE